MLKNGPSEIGSTRTPSAAQVLAALVLVGALGMLVASLAAGAWDEGKAPFPYAWRDVAVVHFLCALPFAWVLARFIQRHVRELVAVALAIFVFGLSLAPLTETFRPGVASAIYSYPFLAVVLRAGSACGLGLSAILLMAVMTRSRGRHAPKAGPVLAGLAALVWFLVPTIHVNERCKQDQVRLGQAWNLARLGEARPLVHGLTILDPRGEWNGQPLRKAAVRLDDMARKLEGLVAQPLAEQATVAQRLERARNLARLGRTQAAIDVLAIVQDPQSAPEVDNLRGGIYQIQGDWKLGLASYRQALAAWESQPPSAARSQGLVTATKGIGYCQRKLGQFPQAEATYQQLLALSPTADSYLLLAEFYEDSRQADKARLHARRAMALDPTRYQQQGDSVLHRLSIANFGCMSIFSGGAD
jgi:hypothetical protein